MAKFKPGEDNPGFKPGQSGNPAGRPKGSRNKLGEEFIQKLYADFQEHGEKAIASARLESPLGYVKTIASTLPKELHVKDASLDDMSDTELVDLLAAVRSIIATEPGEKAKGNRRGAAGKGAAGGQLN